MGYLEEVLADNPILLWALDETAGTQFRDRIGTNHGNVSGGPTLGQPGPGNTRAAQFASASNQSCNRDSSVGTITGSFPTGSAARSVEVWSFPTTSSHAGCGLAYGRSNTTFVHFNFCVGNSTAAGSVFTDGVNGSNNRSWVTAPTLNAWNHCVLTYAGGAGGAAIVYLNGAVDQSTTLSLNTDSTVDRVRSGVRADDARATQYFNGRLAYAAIYSAVLSPTRVAAHRNAMLQSGVVIG